MNDDQLKISLELLGAVEKKYAKGAFLNIVSAPLERFGVVLEGVVQALCDDAGGHHTIMTSVGEGETFGESLALLGRESPVYIVAVSDCRVLWLDASPLRSAERILDPNIAYISMQFMKMQADRVLAMNERIQLLSRLTIRDKVTAYLSRSAHRAGKECFTVPFDRASMAHYLGVDRSALSRELSKMREEGLIDFRGSEFRLTGLAATGE